MSTVTFRLTWLVLIMLLPFLHNNGETVSCREIPLRLISLGDGKPEPGASGSVCFSEKSVESWPLTVKLSGLTPKEYYWLSINARAPESPESTILGTLMVSGWPPGNYHERPDGKKEGYWDFREIQTDSRGSFEATIILPLPSATYRVKFLVKQNYSKGSHVVLHQDALLFTVDPPKPWWLMLLSALTLLALVSIGLFFAFSRRHRRAAIANGARLVTSIRALIGAPSRRRVQPSSDPDPDSIQPGPQPPVGRYVFVRKGDFWNIGYGNKDVLLKHLDGLSCIAYLLGHPNEYVLAVVLYHVAHGGVPLEGIRSPEEKRALARQLGSGLNLERDDRPRQSVTKSISRAKKRIGKDLPSLKRYLDATITTGGTCIYQPNPDHPAIRWEL